MSRVAVIGGGVAGLTAARTVRDAGHDVIVFDKGRRAAGRISTRRGERFEFDHGAQYLTARDPEFAGIVRDLADEGVLARWTGRIVSLGTEGEREVASKDRWVGVPSMSALARALARSLEVEASTRIVDAALAADGWHVHDERSRHFGPFDAVVLAVPPAQAADLMEERSPLTRIARSVRVAPCWAVLLGFAERFDVAFDGAFCEDSPLAWAARNSSKPGRAAGEAWVLHASAEWSAQHLFDDPAEVRAHLGHELATRTGVPLPHTVHRDAHRWRFARASGVEGVEGYYLDRDRALMLCGDWCLGERVEDAWLSGRAAGRMLLAEVLGDR